MSSTANNAKDNVQTAAAAEPVAAAKPKKGAARRGKRAPVVPARASTPLNMGIYISPSRVKYGLDNVGINAALDRAIRDLRSADPHMEKCIDPKTKKVTYETTKAKTFDELEVDTRATLQRIQMEEAKAEQKARDNREKRERKIEESVQNGGVSKELLDKEREVREELKKQREQARKAAAAAAPQSGDDAKRAGRGVARAEAKKPRYAAEIELLSKHRIRFSKDAPVVVAAAISTSLQELYAHGMKVCIANGKRSLQVQHLVQPGWENLSLRCFYTTLDAFKLAQKQEAVRVEQEAKAKDEKKLRKKEEARAAKENKKAKQDAEKQQADPLICVLEPIGDIPVQAAPTAAVAQPAPSTEPEAAADDVFVKYLAGVVAGNSGRDFQHYVKRVCYNIMNTRIDGPQADKAYKNMRFSKQVLMFGNVIVMQFVERFVRLLRSQINIMDVKTVTRDIANEILNSIIVYTGFNPDKFQKTIEQHIGEYTVAQAKRREEKAKAKSGDATATAAAAGDASHESSGDSDSESDSDGEGDATDTKK